MANGLGNSSNRTNGLTGIFKPAEKLEPTENQVQAPSPGEVQREAQEETQGEAQPRSDKEELEEEIEEGAEEGAEEGEEEEEEEEEEELEQEQQAEAEVQRRAAELEEAGQAPEPETAPELPQYDEETQAIVDEATKARERFQEAERGVQDLSSEIRRLEERAERDYGPDEEFASLDGQCFEYADLEYIYSFCPYGRTSQRSKNGGGEVSLGQWNDWVGPSDNRYSAAKFDRGLTCWNGPPRTCLVTLRCGVENKLLQVSEPSRCEYAMEFASPALCNPHTINDEVHDEL
jgi:protein kinase C substrate 80K-H